MSLQLCLSQQPPAAPYTFKTTGINVYTFEEVLYHVFHHWRESADEFLSDNMISWVAARHSYLAVRMKELRKKERFSAKIMDFLRLAQYFSDEELTGLRPALEEWELRREWEQLKERGDFFAQKNEPEQAIALYRRALEFENATLLNNLAVQYMKTGGTREALSALTRALSLEPDNFAVLLHYIEAAILNGSFDRAAKAIQKAYDRDPACADIAFLVGLMAYEQKDYATALMYFEKAIEADRTVAYFAFKAADIHLQTRRFEKALEALRKTVTRDAAYYAKEAEIYAAWGDIPHAIKSMTLALAKEPNAINYAKLAALHRKDYDTTRAELVIAKALRLSPENNIVRLENARIQKSLGKTQGYQASLNEILMSFKEGYRETR